jgi:hypothetical protein
LINSAALVKKHVAAFSAGKTPLNFTTMKSSLKESQISENQQTINLTGHNPFIESLTVDWDSQRIVLNLYPDVQQLKSNLKSGSSNGSTRSAPL